MICRRVMAGLCVCGAAAIVGIVGFLRGQVIPSDFILRSAEELLALRSLMDDATVWPEMLSLSEKMTLWRMGTLTELAPPDAGCLPLSGDGAKGERVRHRFEFASRQGISSRVYRVEYTSCKLSPGQYRVERQRCGFGSDFSLGPDPLLHGTAPLRVLRIAFRDAGVSRDLIDALREQSIAFCRVSYEGPGSPPGVSFYRFLAADSSPPSKVMLEYLVEYDAQQDTASFVRL